MREDSFKRVGPPGPSYIITNIIDHYSTNVYRLVYQLYTHYSIVYNLTQTFPRTFT